ncbi:hypothetical protein A2164_03870 [Candidatus Curtissbacteria bacterium RBG_13_35_7]|uniref:Glycosyltransferase 2-like domain-containing protein n=1 Tax=Candidatus Curtissbacteria bacterium RBG_13_35_7 TaxID=1797705 RepID=A0A1F5G587_9BACT|nr:MAG: hypothetical protein A2164_03870 [Candidatus Curtissbacteria bacterium RBG_13_35_7]
MFEVSIGIMAYNEEGNIGRLLDNLTSQKLKQVTIAEILVVSSGSTDKTDEIIREKAVVSKGKIKLLVQKKREGKASAINLFIKKAKNPILIMISADVLPKQNTIEELTLPFKDRNIGMTGSHIIPVNKPNIFMGYYVTTFWKLHHEVAKRTFKAGECVAWRNIIDRIDPLTSTDETNIAALIIKKGYKCKYVPNAIVYNRGPESFWDFLKVRRRHLAAYYHLKEKVGLTYIPSTMNNLFVLKLYLKTAKPKNIKEIIWLIGVIITEVVGRLVAWYDWRIMHEHHPIWDIAVSTKKLPKGI